MVTGLTASSAAPPPNSPIIGSINGEWKACETASRWTRRPWSRSWSAIAVTASSSPETTTDDGPLTAAMPTLSVSSGRTSSSVGLQRDHGAAGRQRLHEAAARDHQQRGVLQRQGAGDVRRGQLADRVAHHEVGPHSPGLQQTVQRNLDGEQRRLSEFGVFSRFSSWPHITSRSGRNRWRSSSTDRCVERFGEDGIGGVQAHAHAEPLRALAGEDEHGFARRSGRAR